MKTTAEIITSSVSGIRIPFLQVARAANLEVFAIERVTREALADASVAMEKLSLSLPELRVVATDFERRGLRVIARSLHVLAEQTQLTPARQLPRAVAVTARRDFKNEPVRVLPWYLRENA